MNSTFRLTLKALPRRKTRTEKQVQSPSAAPDSGLWGFYLLFVRVMTPTLQPIRVNSDVRQVHSGDHLSRAEKLL